MNSVTEDRFGKNKTKLGKLFADTSRDIAALFTVSV